MTWKVDMPIRIGDTMIAAIVELQVRADMVGLALCGHASKNPLLIMHLSDGKITGLDVNGQGYDEDEIERLYPNAIAQLHKQSIQMHG